MSTGTERSASAGVRVSKATIREDILQSFPGLFGTKTINGREVNVEQEIATLAQELHPEIAAALTARRALLRSPAQVHEKYAWPKWDDTFEDPVTGQFWTYRQIVQGLLEECRLAIAIPGSTVHQQDGGGLAQGEVLFCSLARCDGDFVCPGDSVASALCPHRIGPRRQVHAIVACRGYCHGSNRRAGDDQCG